MTLRSATVSWIVLGAFMVTGAVAGSTGRCGGTGGDKTKTLSCPRGEYIVGVGYRAGQYVDSITVQCQAIAADGEPGRRGARETAGGSGGTRSNFKSCRSSSAFVKLTVHSGIWVDLLASGECRAKNNEGRWVRAYEYLEYELLNLGGTARKCALECPPGEALTSLTVRYGGWIDSISGQCRS
jgi:hypothetical protein